MSLQQTKSETNALRQAAQTAKTASEFVWMIQKSMNPPAFDRDGLLQDVYAWERSTPENEKRFKHTGWFAIASDYWKEHH